MLHRSFWEEIFPNIQSDAEDAVFLQSLPGIHGAHGHGDLESWQHNDGDKVEGTDDDLPNRSLVAMV